MNHRVFILAVLFLAFTAMALTGKVVDQSGAPLQGVIVQLVADGAMVVTGRDGSFTLKSKQPLDAQGVDRSKVRTRLQDGVLLFTSIGGAWRVRTLDLAGNEGAASSGIHGTEGEVQYRVFGSRTVPPGIYLVHYRNGSTTVTIRVAATKQSLAIASPSESGYPLLMRPAALEAVDSLRFSKFDYATRRFPVTDEGQEMGTVVLDRDFGIPWNPGITYGSLTDARDGQSYRTVLIGSQRWMAENLNFRAAGPDSGMWYLNGSMSTAKYGRFYTWSTAMLLPDSCNSAPCASKVRSRHQGICPQGWHVPSNAEWSALSSALGGSNSAGSRLKSTDGWNRQGNGSDSLGFRALAGSLFDRGYMWIVGDMGYWWITSEFDGMNAFARTMIARGDGVYLDAYQKKAGFTVRCLED